MKVIGGEITLELLLFLASTIEKLTHLSLIPFIEALCDNNVALSDLLPPAGADTAHGEAAGM
jgi:hypothetical protein